jgi:hypothetical protein
MSGFSAEWLSLREPADIAARSAGLSKFVARSGRLLDLGGGTGANIRYLSQHLPLPQFWTIVDNDAALLMKAPPSVTAHCADLNAAVEDGGLFAECALVTASALLDLVSERWLDRLVVRCKASRSAVLFALNYDGRLVCSPEDQDDELIRGLVNEHQKRDKGFGPALGPDAATRVVALLERAGYDVRQERSDWRLSDESAELQRELIAGWAHAASEISIDRSADIRAWKARRLTHVDAGRSRLVVGHVDVAARVDVA